MASEVGSGQVSIFPVFNGFRSRMNSEVGAASTAAGRSAGTGFGAAFGRGAGNVGADSSKALTKNVATASAALGKARIAEQDSAGKVRVAEAQLAEARATGAAGSAKVIAAEERLAAAKRKLTEAQDKTKDSSTRLTEAQEKLKEATEATASAGEEGATTYTSGWAKLKDKLGKTIRGALDEANTEAEGASSSGGEQSGNAFTEGFKKAMGALAAVFAVDKIKDFFISGIQGAGDLEQSVGAIEAVFKSGASQMSTWSQTAATDVGLTKNEFNELGTLMGAQLKNGGTAMEDLAPKTKSLIELGADLSSMFGGNTADAVGALSSALKGERDPIEKYGVSLKQASIDAEAASLGFEKVGGSLSDEAQQAATLSLIMKQTADAHGNFAREGDTLAHKQQVLSAMWADGKTQLASALLPAITAVTGFLISGLTPALGFAEKVMGEITGGVRAFGAAFVAADGEITSAGFPGFMEWLAFQFSKLRPLFTEFVGGVRAFGAAFVAADGDITSAGFPGFMEQVGFIASQLVDKLKSVAGGLQETFSGMDLSKILSIGAGIGSLAVAFAGPSAVIGGLVGKFAPLIGTLGKFAPLLKFLTGPLGLISALFVGAYATSEPFREAINGLVMTVGELVTGLLTDLVPIFTMLVSTVLPVVAQLFTALVPVFAQVVAAVVPIISALLTGLMPVITTLISTVLPVLLQIFQAIIPVLMAVITEAILPFILILLSVLMPVIQALLPVVMTVFGFIQATIQNVMTVIQGIIKVVTSLIKGDWNGVWEGIKQIASGVWAQIKNVIDTAINLVKGIINTVMVAISSVWNAGWNNVTSFVSGIWDKITGGVVSMVAGLVRTFNDIPGKIIGALAGLGSSLYNIGRDVVQGLMNGVSSLAGSIGSFFLNLLPGWIVKPFKLALGIASPSKLFRSFGRNIPEGLVQGVDDEAATVETAMKNLVSVPPMSASFSSVTGRGGDGTGSGTSLASLISLLAEFITEARSLRPITVQGMSSPYATAVAVQRVLEGA